MQPQWAFVHGLRVRHNTEVDLITDVVPLPPLAGEGCGWGRAAVTTNQASPASINVGAGRPSFDMLIYVHGFNSSPASTKARQLQARLEAVGRGGDFACPALPDRPAQAVALLEREMARAPERQITLVGSSLGGYYSTWLAEKHGVRAVLVNPAITPH